jgi:anti-sigma regulatory factor (Ser/Thr protein kinase)
MELSEEFGAVQAQAVQVRRVRARRPSLVVTLPAVTGSVRLARKLVTTFGDGTGVPSDDLGLLTSELVTNAIRHAGLAPDGQLSVHARLDGHGMHVSVEDHGPGLRPHPVPDAGRAAGGQGLRLIDTLASGWGSGPGYVWFRLDR